jgi:pimeloyl-ACP methyl ester carboxylesterase
MRLATKIFGEENRGRTDIVLLHGTGARAEMWRRQIQPLIENGFRCIVPDLRGHGDSHEPGDPCDLEEHLRDLEDTIAALDIKFPAAFAGHSLGAIIAMELACRRPELFTQILAISLPGRVPSLTAEAFRWFLGWPYKTIRGAGIHRRLDWRTRELIATNHHTLEQIMLNFRQLDYVAQGPPPVPCPVHFAVGRFDPVAPAKYTVEMHRRLPGSTLEIIEWAGHNPMDSQPAAFNRWFFEKLGVPAGRNSSV